MSEQKEAVKPAKGQRWSWPDGVVKFHVPWAGDFTLAGRQDNNCGWTIEGHPREWFDDWSFIDGTLTYLGPCLPDEPAVAVPVGGEPGVRVGQRRVWTDCDAGKEFAVLEVHPQYARYVMGGLRSQNTLGYIRENSTLIADAPAEEADAADMGITITVDASMQPGTFRIEAYREPPPPAAEAVRMPQMVANRAEILRNGRLQSPPAPRYEVSHNGRDVLAYERLGNAETPVDPPQSFPYWRVAGASAWDHRCAALVAEDKARSFAAHVREDGGTAGRMWQANKRDIGDYRPVPEPWRPNCDELHLCEDA